MEDTPQIAIKLFGVPFHASEDSFICGQVVGIYSLTVILVPGLYYPFGTCEESDPDGARFLRRNHKGFLPLDGRLVTHKVTELSLGFYLLLASISKLT